MIEKKRTLALVTARGGSKGVPHKNTKFLGGKPLIAWTIEAAKKSSRLDRVIVSTDDKQIVEVSKEYGAEVPFIRPKELAQDDSPHIDVVIHAIGWVAKNEKWIPDFIMLLQPTSPFRSSEDIDAAINIGIEKDADTVISVSEVSEHPYFIRRITEMGNLVDFIDKPKGYLPRQILPKAYMENGAIYFAKTEVLRAQRKWYTSKTFPLIMPRERSLDINEKGDFLYGDFYLKSLGQKGGENEIL